MAKPQWTTIELKPLTGILDTRSRPADIPVGALRWKLNMQANREGKMCRRDGFDKAFADVTPYTNFDHHQQGATRENIIFGYEFTSNAGNRKLFDGTKSRVSVLDEATGAWTEILTGMGGTSWRAATVQDTVLLTNNVDDPQLWDLNSGTAASIPELSARGVSAAKIVIAYKGVYLLMNVIQDGTRQTCRIIWNDLNNPTSWSLATADSIAGKQDLEYGDEILAATELLDAVYVFTRRAIWKIQPSGLTSTDAFAFTRIYVEKKNQTGCLVFPNTLVSTGTDVFYMSRDGVYNYNPYIQAPERLDWLHRASGVIFKKAETVMSLTNCDAPVAEFRPSTGELWFSWPSSGRVLNNWTLVASLDNKTADVVDHGFSVFVNYRRTPVPNECNEAQSFLCVSSSDWCWKDWGGVFFREMVTLGASITDDIASPVYTRKGYNTEMTGMIPTGLFDRNKLIRQVLIDDDVSEQDTPCNYRLYIGNTRNLQDPLDVDDRCAVQWQNCGTVPVACIDGEKISVMTAAGQRPSIPKEWNIYWENVFLYFRLVIENADGSPAIGGDVCINRVDFDCLVRPKSVS